MALIYVNLDVLAKRQTIRATCRPPLFLPKLLQQTATLHSTMKDNTILQ